MIRRSRRGSSIAEGLPKDLREDLPENLPEILREQLYWRRTFTALAKTDLKVTDWR
jgi:hypothetical protein